MSKCHWKLSSEEHEAGVCLAWRCFEKSATVDTDANTSTSMHHLGNLSASTDYKESKYP